MVFVPERGILFMPKEPHERGIFRSSTASRPSTSSIRSAAGDEVEDEMRLKDEKLSMYLVMRLKEEKRLVARREDTHIDKKVRVEDFAGRDVVTEKKMNSELGQEGTRGVEASESVVAVLDKKNQMKEPAEFLREAELPDVLWGEVAMRLCPYCVPTFHFGNSSVAHSMESKPTLWSQSAGAHWSFVQASWQSCFQWSVLIPRIGIA